MELDEAFARASGRYRTAQDMVAGGLRDAILSGTLAGGQPLRQEEIARRFGVSKIPVREALRQLEGEGLVSFYPHCGAVVSRLSHQVVEEITEIRTVLETMAFRKAFPFLEEEDLERAEEILLQIDREEDLISRWGELNWRFHATLFAPAQRPRLMDLIKAQHTVFEHYSRVHLVLSDYEKPQQEHYQLLDMCRRKDLGSALDPLDRHVTDTGELLLVSLKEDLDMDEPGPARNPA